MRQCNSSKNSQLIIRHSCLSVSIVLPASSPGLTSQIQWMALTFQTRRFMQSQYMKHLTISKQAVPISTYRELLRNSLDPFSCKHYISLFLSYDTSLYCFNLCASYSNLRPMMRFKVFRLKKLFAVQPMLESQKSLMSIVLAT